MSDNSRMSEALYVGLCHHIGTTTEVTIRREANDMGEMIKKPREVFTGCTSIVSGSYSEGFRFKSSDRDTMYWFPNHKVITDLSQSITYDPLKHSIILVDTDTAPGFVKLGVLTAPRDKNISSSIVQSKGQPYISTLKWRHIMFSQLMTSKLHTGLSNHGPCTKSYTGPLENDLTLCFHCSHWTKLTSYWLKRCTWHNWPPNHVFKDILKIGFHFVPIGSKFGSTENELEWRFSFSLAEKKLVYAMNHTQFLCYGLLKIVLNEIIQPRIRSNSTQIEDESILCSYFMKTTLFWLIQIGHITWNPNNLLDCFWKCFKHLLNCVQRGVFPNFFIPQNNMFIGKVNGLTQLPLLEILNDINETREFCFRESPTLSKIFEPVLDFGICTIDQTFGELKSISDIDKCIKNEIDRVVPFRGKRVCFIDLQSVDNLSKLSLSAYQTLALNFCTSDVLIQLAFTLHNHSPDCTNRTTYKSDKMICNMLKAAFKKGFLSHLLYLAMYYYKTCRYEKAIEITVLTQSKLRRPYTLYSNVDKQRYDETVAEWSLSERMQRAWITHINFNSTLNFMQELKLEQDICSKQNGLDLIISPFVLAEQLNVLSNFRLGNIGQCLKSLTDLQTLLQSDNGSRIPLRIRDISWQILGICQQVVGDLSGALESYQQSLNERSFLSIQKATEIRMQRVLDEL